MTAERRARLHTSGPAELSASEYNLNATRTDAAYDAAGCAKPEDYGASGDGTNVAATTAALQDAFNALGPGKTLLIADGKIYAHNAVLNLTTNGGKIIGGGEIRATSEDTSAVIISGDHVKVEDVKFTCPTTTSRGSAINHHKLTLDGCTGSVLRRCTVDGSKAGGIFLNTASQFLVDSCTVLNTRSDGIHATDGSTQGVISNCRTDNTGDDGIAVVSYEVFGTPCSDIVIHGFEVNDAAARGISVVGGNNIRYFDGRIDGTTAAGIYVACEGTPYFTYGVSDVVIDTVHVSNANTAAPSVDQGGVTVHNGRGAGYSIDRVAISNTSFYNTNASASRQIGLVNTGGGTMTNILLGRAFFSGTGPSTVLATSGVGSYRADSSVTGILLNPVSGDQILQITKASDTERVIAVVGNTDANLNLDPIGVGRVKMEGGNIVVSWVGVPASHTAAGKPAQVAADASAFYICYGTNLWGKITSSGWTISF